MEDIENIDNKTPIVEQPEKKRFNPLIDNIKKLKEEEEEAIFPPERKNTEMIKIEIPILKAPKIVGKIDIDAINIKTKPKKKTRAELREERNIRRNEGKDDKVKKNKELKKEKKKISQIQEDIEKTESIHEKLIDTQENILTNEILDFECSEENILSYQNTEQQEKSIENKSNIGKKINKIIRRFFKKS